MGRSGTGKSYYTINTLIPQYLHSHPTQRVIIFDFNEHWMYSHITKITLDMLPRWRKRGGIFRICGAAEKKVFEYINKYMRNSLILIEDATSFFDKGVSPDDIKKSVVDAKQKNNDFIFQFHGFASAPPLILRFTDAYILFKTDNPNYRREIVGYEEIKSAWEAVMADPNPYAKKFVKI
ncbi:hypothetical protein FACS1894153_0430 [Bacteroidia bacterium]|nr:hypothetical protein FACS1894153_0430 [Bacteroidia bacterium]